MIYIVDGRPVSLNIAGKPFCGLPCCLLDDDVNLVELCQWLNEGYTVSKMLDKSAYMALLSGVTAIVADSLVKAGAKLDSDFSLEKYHLYCSDNETHLNVINSLRLKAHLNNFPVNYKVIDEKVSELCGKSVSCNVLGQIASGYFFIRLVRPFPSNDYNPPHKDAWLDRLRNGLNLYFPLAGSDQNSSLSLVPGSHLWCESAVPRTKSGAVVNGVRYSVPSVMMPDGDLQMTRPEVKQGEGLLFSPYLIHGGAVNFNKDTTRVSLEMRFWRSPA